MIDDHRAVLFGGEYPGYRKSNDVYILDLRRMVSWTAIILRDSLVVPYILWEVSLSIKKAIPFSKRSRVYS